MKDARERAYAIRISVYKKNKGDTGHVVFARGILRTADWTADYMRVEADGDLLRFIPADKDPNKMRAVRGVAKLVHTKFYSVAQFSRAEDLICLLDFCGEYNYLECSPDGNSWYVKRGDKLGYTELHRVTSKHSLPAQKKLVETKPVEEKPVETEVQIPTWRQLLGDEIKRLQKQFDELETRRIEAWTLIEELRDEQRQISLLIDKYDTAIKAESVYKDKENNNEKKYDFSF